MDKKKIQSEIIEIGKNAYFESTTLLILFNETATPYLRDVSIIHRLNEIKPSFELKKGSIIHFGNQKYTIEEIGNLANIMLSELGHVSLYFGLPNDTQLLPGSILLSPSKLPELKVGDQIEFIN